jgi:hypothetical protein
MRTLRWYLWLVWPLLLCCTNEIFLPSPVTQIPEVLEELQKNHWNSTAAPGNLSSTQGKKRAINLTWDSVPGALRYDVYRSASPFGDYERFAHSADPSLTIGTTPGALFYFKVAAVSPQGETGEFSMTAQGTSLAQPQISDILEHGENGENQAVIYWYMNNADDSTYKQKVCYRVSAYEKGNPYEPVVEPVMAYGVFNAVISGLVANTPYEFQVEAWLDEEGEGAAELSLRMDAATARRTRPAAPVELTTVPGSQADRITLSWKLPETVDVLDEQGAYTPHALYFEVKRRTAVGGGGGGPFQPLPWSPCCGIRIWAWRPMNRGPR